MKTVRACPICGRNILVSCYDETTVLTVDMPVSEAIELLKGTIEELEYDLESAKADLETYETQRSS